jgi:hypothetical protein
MGEGLLYNLNISWRAMLFSCSGNFIEWASHKPLPLVNGGSDCWYNSCLCCVNCKQTVHTPTETVVEWEFSDNHSYAATTDLGVLPLRTPEHSYLPPTTERKPDSSSARPIAPSSDQHHRPPIVILLLYSALLYLALVYLCAFIQYTRYLIVTYFNFQTYILWHVYPQASLRAFPSSGEMNWIRIFWNGGSTNRLQNIAHHTPIFDDFTANCFRNSNKRFLVRSNVR